VNAPRPTQRARLGAAGALVVLAAAGGVLAACGSPGTELRDPPVGATSPAPTAATTVPVPQPLALWSPAFAPDGLLPDAHTCHGLAVSPPLSWSGSPDGVVELAISATSAGGTTVHWLLTGLAPGGSRVDEGTTPLEATEGPTSAGELGWSAPCPMAGESIEVTFTLHALTEITTIRSDLSAEEAVASLTALPGVRATLTAMATAPDGSDDPPGNPEGEGGSEGKEPTS
jgi:phosphatidylethanolamine-binding protein (PEBP) family uncharacterized protein